MTRDEIRRELALPPARDGRDQASRVLTVMRDEGLVKYEQDERGIVRWRRSPVGITRSRTPVRGERG